MGVSTASQRAIVSHSSTDTGEAQLFPFPGCFYSEQKGDRLDSTKSTGGSDCQSGFGCRPLSLVALPEASDCCSLLVGAVPGAGCVCPCRATWHATLCSGSAFGVRGCCVSSAGARLLRADPTVPWIVAAGCGRSSVELPGCCGEAPPRAFAGPAPSFPRMKTCGDGRVASAQLRGGWPRVGRHTGCCHVVST